MVELGAKINHLQEVANTAGDISDLAKLLQSTTAATPRKMSAVPATTQFGAAPAQATVPSLNLNGAAAAKKLMTAVATSWCPRWRGPRATTTTPSTST